MKAEVPNGDHNTQSISNKLPKSRLFLTSNHQRRIELCYKVCNIFNYSSKLFQTFPFSFAFLRKTEFSALPEAAKEPFVCTKILWLLLYKASLVLVTQSRKTFTIADDVRSIGAQGLELDNGPTFFL